MESAAIILDQLREKGFRVTNIRRKLLEIFIEKECPLSVSDLKSHVESRGITVNKTTLYREIEFLKAQDLIEERVLSEKEKLYELKGEHHHHIVCRKCDTVERIELQILEKVFPKIERKLKTNSGFVELDHNLEFFGICAQCN